MKLHTKLILSLLGGLILVVAVAQVRQYFGVTISDLAESDIRLLEQREQESAENIFQSVQQSVAGSLERGEMKKFTRLLEAQKGLEGLLEFSLYDRNGIVSHSSDASFLKKRLPDNIKSRLMTEPQMLLQATESEIEIFQPQMITGDCVRCHVDWKTGEIGGITHFRFSTESLAEAERQAQETIADIKKASLRNSLLTLLGIVVVLVVAMYLLVRKFVGSPLGEFVRLLRCTKRMKGTLPVKYRLKQKMK